MLTLPDVNQCPVELPLSVEVLSGLGAAWALHHHPDRFDFRFPERHTDGTWTAKPVFTKPIPRTADFAIDGTEFDLYQVVTRFAKRQCTRAANRMLKEGGLEGDIGTAVGTIQRGSEGPVAVRRDRAYAGKPTCPCRTASGE